MHLRKLKSGALTLLFVAISCASQAQEIQITEVDLVAVLDTIWFTEQEPIRLRDSLGRVHGFESDEFQKQNEIYHRNHDINEKKILEILDTQGWPDRNIIGEQGNLTICNVLQHSGLEVRKKYLPMMRKAVNENELAHDSWHGQKID